MMWQRPSARICELLRESGWVALNPGHEWLDNLDRAVLAADPSLADELALADVVKQAIRAFLVHFGVSKLRDPGAPVPPYQGVETLRMARELQRRGKDTLVRDIYRIVQTVSWHRFTEVAAQHVPDPDDLREVLDVAFRSSTDFVDASIAALTAKMQLERNELTHSANADRRKIVELILSGTPTQREHTETQLGYPLAPPHTAAIIFSNQPSSDPSHLDRAAEAFDHAVGSPQSLTVVADTTTRWVWVSGAAGVDNDKLCRALDNAPTARIAIGTTAPGIDGFRRSYLDARTTQYTMSRLRSCLQVASFADLKLAAVLAEYPQARDRFIEVTLGDFESAAPSLHTTLLTFINQQCNAARTANLLYMHRNTLMRRLEAAQRLLPRPLEGTTVHVAAALEALHWREHRNGDSVKMSAQQDREVTPSAQP
ncbi:PucR family transcriptional regulator [Mycobacterium spongiae]|uniref:PucR family transcriptional regulator n=1 Tax=Mycobacterium spongiae TaxID=886343 RepID=A0A975JWU0_9MYCO|nr:PucR family transcriptional regulator [Mycobacterium spongiae]QUR67155.1 PucR family transcriptional regulator [Mycobacterium spongiae]